MIISGEMPHPHGKIAIAYKMENNKWKVDINLPDAINGEFIWKGKTYKLKAGKNSFLI